MNDENLPEEHVPRDSHTPEEALEYQSDNTEPAPEYPDGGPAEGQEYELDAASEEQGYEGEAAAETREYEYETPAEASDAPYIPPPSFVHRPAEPPPLHIPLFRAEPQVVAPPPQKSAGWVLPLMLFLAGAGGAAWYHMHPKPPPVVVVAPTPAPTPVPATPTPKPVLVKATPEPEKPKEVVAMVPAPVPAPTPEPTPAPVVVKSTLDWKTPMTLDTVASRASAATTRATALLRSAAEEGKWADYNALLVASMGAELARSPDFSSVQRYDRFFENPAFLRVLLQRGLLGRMDTAFQQRVAAEPKVQEFILRICESPETMESLLAALTPENNIADVLGTMSSLAAEDPDVFGKYRDLAVACSLVMAKQLNFTWNGSRYTASAGERYRWFKAKDTANELAIRLHKLNAWQLAWVVSVPVSTDEMEWAVANMRRKFKQGDWGRSYLVVDYDMQYAVSNVRKKPYTDYLFSEILEKGGICGDRAYFSANTARSNGIPAVSISGDGARGPHAWMAWLADEDRWETSGRFDGYPAGRVTDPRNGKEVSEQVFDRLSGPGAPKGASLAKSRRLLWIADVQAAAGQAQPAAISIDYALRTTPRESSVWLRKLAAWSERTPAPAPADWKVFLDAFRRNFPGDTDLLAQVRAAEDRFLLAKMDSAAVKKELSGDIRDLGKLKGLTSLEEIRAAYKRPADLLAKANDFAGIRKLYRDALDDYGREPAKFKGIGADYWTYVQNDANAKQQACRDMEAAFERHVQTRGGDYFDVESQNSAGEYVAQCWRLAGDEKRADKFEKEMAKRAATATKATRVKTP